MNILVVGAGHMGLPTVVGFAKLGHQVICYDRDKGRIGGLGHGVSGIFEKSLNFHIKKYLRSTRLVFTSEVADLNGVEVIVVCLPTDFDDFSKKIDLSCIYEFIVKIAPLLDKRYKVIIVKSTVLSGTSSLIRDRIKQLNPIANVDVCSIPEFLREGTAIRDTFYPDRIVIGVDSERARATIEKLYPNTKHKFLFTDTRSAEMIKCASNAFLAMKIQFINEVSDLCKFCGANIKDVAHGIGLDKRIGIKYLNPGPGYGGYCLPKDTKAIYEFAKLNGVDLSLVGCAIDGNKNRINHIVNQILIITSDCDKITILGLTYKANTSDCRESPAIYVINQLLGYRTNITVFDPFGMEESKKILSNRVLYGQDIYTASKGTRLCVILTEWDDFKNIDFVKLKQLVDLPVLYDCRNLFDKSVLEKHGFEYIGL
jgi:UDPglucose 6-dehydrogenase